MPILGTIASSYLQATGSFFSIASTTLTSATDTVNFTSIPSDYTHLQIRAMIRLAGNDTAPAFYFNADTTESNYYSTTMASNGSGNAYTQNLNYAIFNWTANNNGTTTSNMFSGVIVDILDYKNTSKKKTARINWGGETNLSGPTGRIGFANMLWNSTSAITQIRFYSKNLGSTSNFAVNSTFALYGIKA